MKKGIALIAVAAAAAVFALAGCGGSSSSDYPRLEGRVADTQGAPVAGVTVSVASKPAVATTTNSAGYYALKGVPTGSSEFTVTYAKAGYVESVAVAKVEDGRAATMDVVLLKEGATVAIDGTKDAVAADNRADGLNGKVTLPANSIVSASGTPVANPVVTVTTALPTDPKFGYAYPSLFIGRVGAAESPLLSHGIINVSVKDSTGQPAKLDANKPATVEFPIASGDDPGSATVPLWSLDTATGRWVLEGTANRDNTSTPPVYRAQVTHFSWLAINTYPNGIQYVVVKVVEDPSINPPLPVAGAFVRVRCGNTWQARGITSASDGKVVFAAPAGISLNAKDNYEASKDSDYQNVGVQSIKTDGNTTEVVYWLKPLKTGAETP